MTHTEEWQRADWLTFVPLMLDSYRHWLGRELMARDGFPAEQAERVFAAPFVVVAHGTQADPLLCYANRVALDLWEMDVETLLRTPSRMTAEPMHRDERAALMDRTTREGHATGYGGIRISRTGKRFQIRDAIVWNVLDSNGQRMGQAATFSDWNPVE
ncbi:MAG: MEKHLA domain-containing protein [Bacteroidales bacterium]|nr:MEKHLA domain-containing protein [Bacteroidales bacterium]